MECTQCGRPSLITIRMRVGDEDLVFHRCSVCEQNVWESDDGTLSLDEVLDLARATR